MPTTRKRNVPGPVPRKTLDDFRGLSQDDCETMESTSTPEHFQDISRERSVNNSTLSCADRDDLIDSDNSSSDAYTEDDEPTGRENTPIPTLLPESAVTNRSKLTPLKQMETREKPQKLSHSEMLLLLNDEGSGTKCAAYMLIGAFFVLVGAPAILYFLSNKSPEPAENDTRIERCEKFYSLEQRYKHVDSTLWDSLQVSFIRANAVKKLREPGTFLFLHDGPTKTVDRFIENVANITANCLGGTKPIVLGSNYFKRAEFERDFGVFLSQQTEALREQGIMVVRNLEDVPPKAAQAFHSICDPVEPLVDKAVIYFTMDTSKVSGNVINHEQSATADAEKLLQQIWKGTLKPEVLDPLIVRLTENVYRIG